MKLNFKIVSSPEGDWEIIYCNDKKIYSGHGARAYELFRGMTESGFDVTIEEEEVSDEEMESLC